MILRSLGLRRFKKFADWTTTFSPGLNVIHGPNEAGKTTVLEALFAALLTNPAHLPPGFADRVRPWGERRLGESVLELQVDGRRYFLRKDFEAGTVLLQSLDRKDREANPREVHRRILGWLGLPGEGAVRSTAYVGQDELAHVADEHRLIGTYLSRVLGGAGAEDVASALRWIDGRQKALETLPLAASRGDEHLQALLRQQRELESKEAQMRAHWRELDSIVQQLTDQERQVRARSEHATAAEQNVTLRRREGELERELRRARDRLARLDAVTERLSRNEAALNAAVDQKHQTALQEFVRALGSTKTLQQGQSTAHQELERGEAALEKLAERYHRERRHAGMGLTVGGLGAATTAAGLLLTGLQSAPGGWGLALGGALLMLLGIRLRGQAAQTESIYRDEEQQVLDMREKVEEARGHLQEAKRALGAALQALGASSVEAVHQRFAGSLDLVHQHGELLAALQQIGGDQSREDLLAHAQETERELQDIRQRVPQARQAPSPAELVEPLPERQHFQKDIPALKERKAWLEGRIEGLRDESDRRQVLEEQIAALQHQQAHAREAIEVLNLTRLMLEEARKQSHVPVRELLERRAGEYLQVVTQGGYEKVAVDEHTLVPRVWVAAARAWKGPGSLSKGTIAQLYLALRLALLDVLCQGRTPPVFLDEPFVHFDAERLRAVMPLLMNVARQRQVFLFTSRVREELLADQIITLSR